ncbi:sigma factor [Nonomuraea sp. KM88]|uniref:sigma factor n=1 Tax=Nonomuraea sp. KM88 TaxID=3457427 RepID=UPI003FCCF920
MNEHDFLTDRFEEHRRHLRAVAHQILGSAAEADGAVQETWLRLNRSYTSEVENLRGWLTTVVARVALTMLRSRTARSEEPLDVPALHLAQRRDDTRVDPEHQAIVSDSVGLAVPVKNFETVSCYLDAMSACGVGGLIHAAVGSAGGLGGRPNRVGLAA